MDTIKTNTLARFSFDETTPAQKKPAGSVRWTTQGDAADHLNKPEESGPPSTIAAKLVARIYRFLVVA
jgi:hypothetical protein